MRFPLLLLCFISINTFSQPFVDVINLSHQNLNSNYSPQGDRFVVQNSYANITLPIKVDSNNYFIFRLNGERLQMKRRGVTDDETSVSTALSQIGWQRKFNQKLTVTALALPKLTSDFKEKIVRNDFQLGGTFLVQYKIKPNCTLKLGVYYNREPFGNFFVPLVGADWKFTPRKMIYGNLPLGMRYEYKVADRFYTGLGVRIYGRSYRIAGTKDTYIWNQENQLKVFTDYYLTNNFVLFTEIGQTFGYGYRQYNWGEKRDNPILSGNLFKPVYDGIFILAGTAYRITTGR